MPRSLRNAKNDLGGAVLYGCFGLLSGAAAVADFLGFGPRHVPHINLFADGSRVLFDASRGRKVNAFTMTRSGGDVRRVSASAESEFDPAASPDGRLIAYSGLAADNPHGSQIFLMDADGSHPRRLTFSEFADGAPSFSPDGSRIVFYRASVWREAHMGGYRWNGVDIVTVGVDGSAEERLTSEQFYGVTGPCFSPDGERIVFAGEGSRNRAANDSSSMDVLVLNTRTGDLARLTHGPKHPESDYHWFDNREPSYSPDGRHIVFTSDRTEPYQHEIWLMQSDGSDLRQVTIKQAQCSNPVFCPDGKSILYLRDQRGRDRYELWQVDVDGGNQRRIAGSSVFHG